MKTNSLNIKNSGAARHTLAVLLTVTASLLFSSSAWADYGFFDQGTCDLQYYYKDYDNNTGTYFACSDNGCSRKSGNTVNRGVVKDLYIKQWWAKTWKSGTGDVCWVRLCYYVEGKTSSSEYNHNYCNAITGGQQWGCNNQNTNVLSLVNDKPGNYNLNYYFHAYMGNGSCSTDVYSNTDAYYHTINFIIPGFSTSSGTQEFSNTRVNSTTTVTDIDLGTHYGTTTTATAQLTSGNTGDFAITSCDASKITVSFTPTELGKREATITITDAYSKTRTLTVSGKGISNNTPTVLIAKNEVVELNDVTLSGYIKYTGCLTMGDYGFVYSSTSATPTVSDTKVLSGNGGSAGSTYTSTFTEGVNGNYNYRAFITAGSDVYYSTEVRQFTINTECSVTEGYKSTVLRTIGDGTTQGTEYAVAYASSVTAYLKSTTSATTYTWACKTYPDGATVQIASTSSRNTTVTVDKAGTYTFTLSAQCTGQSAATESDPVTLYVCQPASSSTLTLDGYTANVVCEDEGAVAELVSESGYTYTLYRTVEVDESEVTTKIGSQPGTGKTISWSDVQGAGTFTVTAYQTGLAACESISGATVGSADQTLNKPTLAITSIASAMSYQPVTISKVDLSSTVDTEPTWLITNGTGGYLLNSSTGLSYDGEAVSEVILKAAKQNDAGTEYVTETYTVQGSATKTVAATSTSPEKTCSATDSVSITVSPATEDCD